MNVAILTATVAILKMEVQESLITFRICHSRRIQPELKMSLITCIFCKCQIPGGSPANLAKYKEHLQVQLSLVVVVVVVNTVETRSNVMLLQCFFLRAGTW